MRPGGGRDLHECDRLDQLSPFFLSVTGLCTHTLGQVTLQDSFMWATAPQAETCVCVAWLGPPRVLPPFTRREISLGGCWSNENEETYGID